MEIQNGLQHPPVALNIRTFSERLLQGLVAFRNAEMQMFRWYEF